MGMWTIENITPDILERNDTYGHYFIVKFRLKYTPSLFGQFIETPRLEWKEKITLVEPDAGTWWEYTGDQFARNPGSATFKPWVNRYLRAYDCIKSNLYNQPCLVYIYDSKGQPIPKKIIDKLKNKPKTSQQKADFIRDYLKNNGGIIEISIVDVPGLNKPRGQDNVIHKNRILTFDCGLKALGRRTKAYQHLTLDSSKQPAQWFRACQLSDMAPYIPVGSLRKIPVPDNVSIIKPFTGGAMGGTFL